MVSTSLVRSAAAAVIALAAAAPATALVITPTYDSTVTSSPDKVQIESAFGAIISQYEAMFSNAITVTVTLDLSPDVGLGENLTYITNLTGAGSVSYSQFRSALSTDGSGGNALAATEAATLPNTTNAPIDSTSEMELSLPGARALGFSGANFEPPSGQTDSTLSIVTSQPSTVVQFARVDGQIAADDYDFTSVAEHELDEILGLGSSLNDSSHGAPPDYIRPEDLFRYDQDSTTRSFTLSAAAMAFVSINGGVSDLVQLSQDPDGDYGDFYSPGPNEPSSTPCTATVQVAFTCPGRAVSVTGNSVEVQMLAAMGYNTRFSTAVNNTTWAVNCSAGTVTSSGVQNVSKSGFPEPGSSGTPDALGALLGTPTQKATISPAPAPGDVIAITGICEQDVTVTTSNLVIANREGLGGMDDDGAVEDADGIEGQLEIAGAQKIVITGLSLGNFDTTFSFAAASDVAVLSIHDGATVTVAGTDVTNSPAFGALIQRQSQVTFFNDNFYYNGLSSGDAGIAVLTNSRAMLGADDGSLSVTVLDNGGDGVTAGNGSTLIVNAAELTQNGDRQLSLLTASTARLIGSGAIVNVYDGSIESESCETAHGANCGIAIEVAGASALELAGGASVSSIDENAAGTSGAIKLIGGSALLAQDASIESPSGAAATIDASENSIIALAGGNTICSKACTSATTGTAIEIDHVATFMQAVPAEFGFSAAADTIFGGGSVLLQSTVDIGQGTVGKSGPPSLDWTTGTGGISVAQNSSFRLNGGTAITGALALSQASNGFFNTVNGGTNSVTGGVTCPFANIPASHVAGPTAVSPNVAIGTSFFTTPSGTCLPF